MIISVPGSSETSVPIVIIMSSGYKEGSKKNLPSHYVDAIITGKTKPKDDTLLKEWLEGRVQPERMTPHEIAEWSRQFPQKQQIEWLWYCLRHQADNAIRMHWLFWNQMQTDYDRCAIIQELSEELASSRRRFEDLSIKWAATAEATDKIVSKIEDECAKLNAKLHATIPRQCSPCNWSETSSESSDEDTDDEILNEIADFGVDPILDENKNNDLLDALVQLIDKTRGILVN